MLNLSENRKIGILGYLIYPKFILQSMYGQWLIVNFFSILLLNN